MKALLLIATALAAMITTAKADVMFQPTVLMAQTLCISAEAKSPEYAMQTNCTVYLGKYIVITVLQMPGDAAFMRTAAGAACNALYAGLLERNPDFLDWMIIFRLPKSDGKDVRAIACGWIH
jgi:hypothetical protein